MPTNERFLQFQNVRLAFVFILLTCALNSLCASDTLWQKWVNEDLSDSVRLKALHATIWENYMYAQPDSAYELAQLALEYAKSKGDTASMISSLSIQGVSFNQRGDSDEAIAHLEMAMNFAVLRKDENAQARLAGNMGNTHVNQGQYSKALLRFQQCLRLSIRTGDRMAEAGSLLSIGHIYHYNHRSEGSLEYLRKALPIFREEGNAHGIAMAMMSMGTSYKNLEQFDSSITYFDSAWVYVEQMDQPFFLAQWHHHMGALYLKNNMLDSAMVHYSQCEIISKEADHMRYQIGAMLGKSKVFDLQGNRVQAMRIAQEVLTKAKELGALEEQLGALDILFKGYKEIGNAEKALSFHEEKLLIEDSLALEETAEQLQQMEFSKQLLADSLQQEEAKLKVEMAHQQEVAEKDKTRNMLMGGGLLLLFTAIGLYSRVLYVRKAKDIIEKEKDRSENLLLNILPAEIAEELKEKGEAAARDFDMVSILFTDFKGFTQLSETLSAADLVAEINVCFKAFDGIVGKYNIEKIKTIGDAYMCAGGLPVPDENAVKNTVHAGLEMQAFMIARKSERDAAGLPAFEMRVGIHTGPVVAGIVGVKKFQYDIWGDTVNTASRMESSGEVGQVNISEATYKLVKENSEFGFTSRGKVEAKGKGEMEMYFVSRSIAKDEFLETT